MKLLEYRWYFLAGAIAVVIFIFAGWSFTEKEEYLENDLFANDLAASEEVTQENHVIEEKEEQKEIKVDVKGAVHVPGLYIAFDGERVFDLVEKAGGFTAEADLRQVNLAQIVDDQMVIYVPAIGEELENLPSETVSVTGNAQKEQKVNLNTASEMELQTLTGIGPSKATAIIQYRTENGPFKSIEELKSISGIGEKTFEKLKEDITI